MYSKRCLITIFAIIGSFSIERTQSCAGFGGSGGGANGQIGTSEISNTPRFVFYASPPVSWTAPSNGAPYYSVAATADVVAMPLLNAMNNLNDTKKTVKRAMQIAFESSIRNVLPGYGAQIVLDMQDFNGIQINAYTYPNVVNAISANSTGDPSGGVEVKAVTKLCARPCTVPAAGRRKKRDLEDHSTPEHDLTLKRIPAKSKADIGAQPQLARSKRQAVACVDNKPFPPKYEGCFTPDQFDKFVVTITVRITQGPLLSGQQWYQVRDAIFTMLNQDEGVQFDQEIEVYAS